MHKFKFVFLSVAITLYFITNVINLTAQSFVVLQTSAGDIKLMLYDETKLHKENFIKLVKQGYYNGILFHRVISGFMIQAGDPASVTAKPGQALGSGGPAYTIPAEFFPSFYHKKGALAAARQSDAVNPKKESSGSQFYIVQGTVYRDSQLKSLENTQKHLPFTTEQRSAYTTIGGTPQLDNAYTVFGEVIEGLEIVDKIAASSTDERNRPLTDIKILKAYLIE
jgi:cyclophilin family peptidyl-prolyl cis-trans isomerase